MKKFISLFLIFAMVFSFAACSSQTPGEDQAQQPAASQSGDGSDAGGNDAGRTLVVYFSATGNTEEAANYIAEATGGDIFEIQPAEPYTDDDLNWTDDNSRVTREHEDESLRDVELVADTADNWDQYDTVFIGYPIWLAYHKLIQCTQLA